MGGRVCVRSVPVFAPKAQVDDCKRKFAAEEREEKLTSVEMHVLAPATLLWPRLVGEEATQKRNVDADSEAYRNAHGESAGEGSAKWLSEVSAEIYRTLPLTPLFRAVCSGSFVTADIAWLPESGLHAAYNCVDGRYAFTHPHEPNSGASITYGQLLREVCSLANVLTQTFGVKKGDTVSIYLPMTWHAAAAFLACARIGAIHSVVFAGFSAESLRDRVNDCESRVLVTSDEGKRGGKVIAPKAIIDAALKECPKVEYCLVLERTGGKIGWTEGRDRWWHEEVAKVPKYCPPTIMAAEDPLFILYTSGSTGKPKGVVHTTGGYLLCAALTVKYVFDVHPGDRFAYIVYGPLLNGVTTLMFESTPVYPSPARYWETVAKHKVTQFYSAPTAIRLLRRLGVHHVSAHDLSTLRILGSVGEPINPEAWNWHNENVGKKVCAVVDTWWQTETGSIVITPFPGAVPTKPGSATVPFFGHHPVILDAVSGDELSGNSVEGVLALKNHTRYLETYMKPYSGLDEDGYIWIKGRIDDVINVSGHRLSTAEIESALIMHKGVAETAGFGTVDELTGWAVYAFVALEPLLAFVVDTREGPSLPT
ncbi:acetyl-coenzyme a synthetase [Favolaschia claudopus]|uniref:acetate--CoA ligase n=1 Tax=Favolaschia claudopus TaxID=2862362 RepID=A0AAW0D1B6_9AGAR